MHSALITFIFLSLAHFASPLMANDQIYKRNSWSADKLFRLSVDQFFRWSVVQLFGCSAVQLFRWSVDLFFRWSVESPNLHPLPGLGDSRHGVPSASSYLHRLARVVLQFESLIMRIPIYEDADHDYDHQGETALSKPAMTERHEGRCPQCT